MSGFVKTPLKVFELREAKVISAEQVKILVYAYRWMDWPTHRVAAYSAHRVCEFYGLRLTKANLRRYQRAALGLFRLGIIKRDYRRLDPRCGDPERCYSIWLMSESQWEEWAAARVGDSLSIRVPHVALNESDTVAQCTTATDEMPEGYAREESDIVAVNESDKWDSTSTTQKEIPPAPRGVPPLPSPLGMRSSAAGLLEPPLPSPEGKHLPAVGTDTTDKARRIRAAARRYSHFVNWLYQCEFTPNEEHVAALLSEFSPRTLVGLQFQQFPSARKWNHNDFGYFFRHAARTLILAQDSALDIPADKNGSFRSDWGRDRSEVIKKIEEIERIYSEQPATEVSHAV